MIQYSSTYDEKTSNVEENQEKKGGEKPATVSVTDLRRFCGELLANPLFFQNPPKKIGGKYFRDSPYRAYQQEVYIL